MPVGNRYGPARAVQAGMTGNPIEALTTAGFINPQVAVIHRNEPDLPRCGYQRQQFAQRAYPGEGRYSGFEVPGFVLCAGSSMDDPGEMDAR